MTLATPTRSPERLTPGNEEFMAPGTREIDEMIERGALYDGRKNSLAPEAEPGHKDQDPHLHDDDCLVDRKGNRFDVIPGGLALGRSWEGGGKYKVIDNKGKFQNISFGEISRSLASGDFYIEREGSRMPSPETEEKKLPFEVGDTIVSKDGTKRFITGIVQDRDKGIVILYDRMEGDKKISKEMTADQFFAAQENGAIEGIEKRS